MSRPNIVLITADQLRHDYVGAYKLNDFIQTPSIDSLAENGCLFTNAYSPNPVCIPARHNLITGLSAKHHGFDDNYFGKDAKACPWHLPTFAQIASDVGYSTIAIGKIHFQPERRSTGFDRFINADEVVSDVQEDDYAMDLIAKGYGDCGSFHGVRNLLYMQPQQCTLPQEYHGSHWIADKAIHYIQQRGDTNRPFLMWVGFKDPHPPFNVLPEWADKYKGKIPKHTSSITPLSKLAEENKCIANLTSEESINRMRELYASSTSFMDYNVGRIINTLKERNMLDNTLIIFTSDHGEMLGDLDTYQKFLSYDASCKIPLIMHWPNRIKPTIKTEFYDLNDILPTIIDVAQTTYPGSIELPGESVFMENGVKDRSLQYIEHQRDNKRWVSLRNKRYKYVYYYGDDDQLFDMENDPLERVNLLYNCKDASIYTIRDDLKQQLINYEEKYGLEGMIKNNDFVKLPPYEIKTYSETCFPSQTIRNPHFATIKPLEQEILEAIKNEPTTKLSTLKLKEILLDTKQVTQERVDWLLNEAKKINRY